MSLTKLNYKTNVMAVKTTAVITMAGSNKGKTTKTGICWSMKK